MSTICLENLQYIVREIITRILNALFLMFILLMFLNKTSFQQLLQNFRKIYTPRYTPELFYFHPSGLGFGHEFLLYPLALKTQQFVHCPVCFVFSPWYTFIDVLSFVPSPLFLQCTLEYIKRNQKIKDRNKGLGSETNALSSDICGT